jgi:hypothetical protein
MSVLLNKNNIQEQVDFLRNQTDLLIEKAVGKLSLMERSSYILGDEIYSTQFYLSHNEQDTINQALSHQL